MIVLDEGSDWRVYFHRAHALLAMKIGLALDPSLWPVPGYFAEALSAITEHDNGQPDWNGSVHLNDHGEPLDYREKSVPEVSQAKISIRNALYKSSFMALLVSLHFSELYEDIQDQDIQDFIREQERLRDRLAEGFRQLSLAEIRQTYGIVRWCDELSLQLCQAMEMDPGTAEVGEIGENKYTLHRLGDFQFSISPWCFTDQEVTFHSEYVTVPKRCYSSDEQLRAEVDVCHTLTQVFRLKQGGL